MTVLVDEARWAWRGTHWAHLVSDESLDELHEVARRLGKRRLGFQGDHYDVDVVDRSRALDLGVVAVDARELIRRLRAAGLRRARPKPSWRQLAVSRPGVAADAVRRSLGHEGRAGERLLAALDGVDAALRTVTVGAFADPTRVVVLLDMAAAEPRPDVVGADVDELVVGEPRPDGEHSIELFVHR